MLSTQNLNLLMRQYVSGGKPETVIFYDGFNDVDYKCRTENGFYSAVRERRIQEILRTDGSRFLKLFKPIVAALNKQIYKLGRRFSSEDSSDWYNCHTNISKATLIAQNLIQDWDIAKRLVESNGGRFIAILQPISYIGTPNIRYLPSKEKGRIRKLQFESVYPKIKEQAAKSGLQYVDLTDIFDGDELIYIDNVHVIPDGNRKIALAIKRLMK